QFERHSKDDDENGFSQKELDSSDTITKDQAALNEAAKDPVSPEKFGEEEEVEKED
ncbi:hypothetical protein BGZ50_008904, partial [Haplosporangium sp. Z 11]